MMEEYLAHSGKNGYPAQTYVMHVKGTQKKSIGYGKRDRFLLYEGCRGNRKYFETSRCIS